MTRYGQTGSSPLGSILGLLFGGGAALVVAALFMTGLAQRQIVPWARARAEQAMARATSAVKPGSKAPVGGAAGESGAAERAARAGDRVSGMGTDGGAGMAGSAAGAGDSAVVHSLSLEALGAQIETQKAFLAQREAELTRMRAGIDSLHQANKGIDETEQKRQAKLLAAMKPDEAARVLARVDDATLALLLDAMNAKAAAKVMAMLDPGRMAALASRAVHKGEMTGVVKLEGQEAGPAPR